jgi:polyisoprenoid-binding protein YceI
MSSTTTTGLEAVTGTWTIDPTHTTIGFSARHAMVAKVRGRFAEFEGTLVLDGADVAASKADLTIQAASIDTKTADRDAHLTSADFLDVENYPPSRSRPRRCCTRAATTSCSSETSRSTGSPGRSRSRPSSSA